jgi:hypothetical protein
VHIALRRSAGAIDLALGLGPKLMAKLGVEEVRQLLHNGCTTIIQRLVWLASILPQRLLVGCSAAGRCVVVALGQCMFALSTTLQQHVQLVAARVSVLGCQCTVAAACCSSAEAAVRDAASLPVECCSSECHEAAAEVQLGSAGAT